MLSVLDLVSLLGMFAADALDLVELADFEGLGLSSSSCFTGFCALVCLVVLTETSPVDTSDNFRVRAVACLCLGSALTFFCSTFFGAKAFFIATFGLTGFTFSGAAVSSSLSSSEAFCFLAAI